MMKSLFFYTLFIALYSCCENPQTIEGTWVKENYENIKMVFDNGIVEMLNSDEKEPTKSELIIKYNTVYENNFDYLIFQLYRGDSLLNKVKKKYKIENKKLYLPREMTKFSSGAIMTGIYDYADVYIFVE